MPRQVASKKKESGTLTALLVQPGQRVAQGEILAIMEAMKMEHTITAPGVGMIKAIHYKVGDLVAEGAELRAYA